MALPIIATIQAGEVGKILQFPQDPVNGPSPAGATYTLVISLNGTNTSYVCGWDGTNRIPQYTTVGTEFPDNGTTQLFTAQLLYTNTGQSYKSAEGSIKVLPNLV